MTAPTTTPSEPSFFAALACLHGHRCPMSILGARLGLAARAALGVPGGTRLGARYHHRNCALDGIQLATGCTLGNRNLQVEPLGEHRLLLWAEEAAGRVAARLTQEALELGRDYARLREAAADLPPGSPDRLALESRLEGILAQLETAPEEDLVFLEPAAG